LKYFFDAHFSPALPKILRALEIDAEGVKEKYGPDAQDEDFIPLLDPNEVIFITVDRHIRTRPAEARALQEVGVRSLFFGPFWQGKDRWKQAEWLTTTWQRVDAQARLLAPGAWVWVRANGDLAEESEYPQRVRIRQRRRRDPPRLQL
jgi:hypothetical protein